mmetsp:Transcript_13919/g.45041  ORF Transcript_13919/g.45041 Transcript_13919/m.45041 type:complete len:245 (+) Transcript_13919:1171-1905(+)
MLWGGVRVQEVIWPVVSLFAWPSTKAFISFVMIRNMRRIMSKAPAMILSDKCSQKKPSISTPFGWPSAHLLRSRTRSNTAVTTMVPISTIMLSRLSIALATTSTTWDVACTMSRASLMPQSPHCGSLLARPVKFPMSEISSAANPADPMCSCALLKSSCSSLWPRSCSTVSGASAAASSMAVLVASRVASRPSTATLASRLACLASFRPEYSRARYMTRRKAARTMQCPNSRPRSSSSEAIISV